MKLAIVGSRTFPSDMDLDYFIGHAIRRFGAPTEIVSGGAMGIDRAAERHFSHREITIKVFLPDWTTGKGGHIRNREIAEYCDAALVIWDGRSRGTQNTLEHLRELKKDYILFTIAREDTYFSRLGI